MAKRMLFWRAITSWFIKWVIKKELNNVCFFFNFLYNGIVFKYYLFLKFWTTLLGVNKIDASDKFLEREGTLGTQSTRGMLDKKQSYWMVLILFKLDESITRKWKKRTLITYIKFAAAFSLWWQGMNLGASLLLDTKLWSSHDRIELELQPNMQSIGNSLLYNINQCYS